MAVVADKVVYKANKNFIQYIIQINPIYRVSQMNRRTLNFLNKFYISIRKSS